MSEWIIIHCLLQALDMEMVQTTHPDYAFYQLFSEPADVGFNGTARLRTWIIGAHVEKTVALQDPFMVFEQIKAGLKSQGIKTAVSDYLIASSMEIRAEESAWAFAKGLTAFVPGSTPQRHLLTNREELVRAELDCKYEVKYKRPAASNKDLVYFLGDSAEYCSWSARSAKIPTYRLNSSSGHYWLPHLNRVMTQKERLVSMGFPVATEMAEAMNVPKLGAADCRRAADILGNSMHLQTCGIMQLVALSCFGPWEISSGDSIGADGWASLLPGNR